jgi:hypothetical protein
MTAVRRNSQLLRLLAAAAARKTASPAWKGQRTGSALIGRLHAQYDRNRNGIAIYSRACAVTARR